jgi:hypothetical protein
MSRRPDGSRQNGSSIRHVPSRVNHYIDFTASASGNSTPDLRSRRTPRTENFSSRPQWTLDFQSSLSDSVGNPTPLAGSRDESQLQDILDRIQGQIASIQAWQAMHQELSQYAEQLAADDDAIDSDILERANSLAERILGNAL